jgi:hypothetical protein
MDYNQILTTIGVTQGRLETIIIFTVIAIGIGIIAVMYWKFLLAGFFALILLFVFSRSESTDIQAIAKPAPIPTVIEEPKTVIEVKPGQGTASGLWRGGVIEKIVGSFECGPHIVITRVQPIFRHVVV